VPVVLSSIRVAIGPVMAGAGVVVMVLWLGARLTIADELSGLFFLIEKAFQSSHQVSK
jgi:small-conductance mechanosensitive channel